MIRAFSAQDRWAWDDKQERARVEAAYSAMIHEQYLAAHPEFKPGCDCHRKAKETK
jgi:hypothetical protein